MTGSTREEMLEFNKIKERALQELAKYKGSRVSTYRKDSINPNAIYGSRFDYKDHNGVDMVYKLRVLTTNHRKPDLTKDRVDNVIHYTNLIEKYQPNEGSSINEAYAFFKRAIA
jgi:hypothetical protein